MTRTPSRILVVDDEPEICRSCEKIFRRSGHDITTAASGREALRHLEEGEFDVVFTDLKMVDVGGMEVLQKVRQEHPETVVVVITGYATVASAVETMRCGAFDYLPKPFTAAELNAVCERALSRRGLLRNTPPAPDSAEGLPGLIGRGPRMRELSRLVRKVAPTECTVLLVGESGTGKDLTARAIHAESPRKGKNFIAVDISSLTSTLLESELFGHVKGAFTGATAEKPGLFDIADGGTIFLDEIGNLLPETQSRLLRVLQEKEFMPVGSTSVHRVDVRLIFATNRNLRQLVGEGSFREDLYYRLNVFPVRIPPLRERPEDIPELVAHFLAKHSRRSKLQEIDPDGIEALMEYHWPGNVRELEHVVERLIILADGDRIDPVHVSAALFHTESVVRSALPRTGEELKRLKQKIRESSVRDVEKRFIEEALRRNDWNISRAARDVDMQRQNFQALMRKYGVARPSRDA